MKEQGKENQRSVKDGKVVSTHHVPMTHLPWRNPLKIGARGGKLLAVVFVGGTVVILRRVLVLGRQAVADVGHSARRQGGRHRVS